MEQIPNLPGNPKRCLESYRDDLRANTQKQSWKKKENVLRLGNRKYKKESKTVHALIQRGNKRKRRKNVGFQCFVIIAYINRVPVKHIECVPLPDLPWRPGNSTDDTENC